VGCKPAVAKQVARQLTARDALGAHARDELGIFATFIYRAPRFKRLWHRPPPSQAFSADRAGLLPPDELSG
jgi:hypothetical protein